MIEIILNKGADVNTINEHGNTALHRLFDSIDYENLDSHFEIIQELVDNGADPKIVNDQNKTAINIAERKLEWQETNDPPEGVDQGASDQKKIINNLEYIIDLLMNLPSVV